MSPQLAFPGPNEVPGFAVPLHRSLTEPILLATDSKFRVRSTRNRRAAGRR